MAQNSSPPGADTLKFAELPRKPSARSHPIAHLVPGHVQCLVSNRYQVPVDAKTLDLLY